MATPETMAVALNRAGLEPVLVDTPSEPLHIAVPFPGKTVEDEPVLRINLLESTDGDLELWQLVVVIPAQAVSDRAWHLTRNMLHAINQSLTIGKMLTMEAEQMMYFSYSHLAPPDDSALRSGPAVVRFVLENLEVLSPALEAALGTEPAPDFDAAEQALKETQASLSELLDQLTSQR